MLRDGEIDALYCATRPSTLGCGTVDHLFPNFVEVEKAYFAETQILPIMHVIAIRRDVHERHPWLARAVCKAFALSLDKSYEALNERAALRYMLPWLQQHVEETKQALGSDRYWRDGLADNRHGASPRPRPTHSRSYRQVPQLLVRAGARQAAPDARGALCAVDHASLRPLTRRAVFVLCCIVVTQSTRASSRFERHLACSPAEPFCTPPPSTSPATPAMRAPLPCLACAALSARAAARASRRRLGAQPRRDVSTVQEFRSSRGSYKIDVVRGRQPVPG